MPEVVHVAPAVFGARARGGGERYPLELARAMAALVPTRLVTFGAARRRLVDGALEVRVLPVRHRWHGAEINPLSERLPLELAGGRIVHAHQYRSVVTDACVVLGRGLGKSVFCSDHGGSATSYADLLHLDRFVTGFLAVSRFSAGLFPRLAGRSSVIYGGVDTERFRPDRAVPRRREVCFVGRQMPHKGIDVLIEAIDGETELHVYGPQVDPGYRRVLERLAASKHVTFHDDAADAEIVAAYRRARVAVLPSVPTSAYGYATASSELLGLVLLEAMACGTPVIGTEIGGVPEVIREGETGFVVPPGDAESLGARIAELLDGGSRWDAMSRAAVEDVRYRFTWQAVAVRCLRAYVARDSASRIVPS